MGLLKSLGGGFLGMTVSILVTIGGCVYIPFLFVMPLSGLVSDVLLQCFLLPVLLMLPSIAIGYLAYRRWGARTLGLVMASTGLILSAWLAASFFGFEPF